MSATRQTHRPSGPSRSATTVAPACPRRAWSYRTPAASTSTSCCSCCGRRRRSARSTAGHVKMHRRQGAAVAGRRDRPDPRPPLRPACSRPMRRCSTRARPSSFAPRSRRSSSSRSGCSKRQWPRSTANLGTPGTAPSVEIARARQNIAAYQTALGRPFTAAAVEHYDRGVEVVKIEHSLSFRHARACRGHHIFADAQQARRGWPGQARP